MVSRRCSGSFLSCGAVRIRLRDRGKSAESSRSPIERWCDGHADEGERVSRRNAAVSSNRYWQFEYERRVGSEWRNRRHGGRGDDFRCRALHSAGDSSVATERDGDGRKPGGFAGEWLVNHEFGRRHRGDDCAEHGERSNRWRAGIHGERFRDRKSSARFQLERERNHRR
jgi:hypothetical protein